MADLNTKQLLVAHRLRDAAGHGMAAKQADLLQNSSFYIATCLREIAVFTQPAAAGCRLNESGMEWYRGQDAYSFLLQTATGLNSSVPGETNILGQFRIAWQDWRQQAPAEQVCRLHGLMQQLFADSKKIRSEFLQGIGGNSYGSLVRKLLRPTVNARILFVGTGKLAHSMLPLFNAFDIAIWNRTASEDGSLTALKFPAQKPMDAARWATHVVMTTPADPAHDSLWVRLTHDNVLPVVHLGRRRAEPGIWSTRLGQSNYFDLDDVFDLRSQQSTVRSLQIRRARRACEIMAASDVHMGAQPSIGQQLYA